MCCVVADVVFCIQRCPFAPIVEEEIHMYSHAEPASKQLATEQHTQRAL